jgi:chromosome segregation ATPase
MSRSRAKRGRRRTGSRTSSTRPVIPARRASRDRPREAPRSNESADERLANLLQIDTQIAIRKNREALDIQFQAALNRSDADSAEKIFEGIKGLNDQAIELSRISLDALEESEEVKQTIRQLSASAKDLEDEAARITNIASALRKGAEALQKATEIVSGLRTLIPIG